MVAPNSFSNMHMPKAEKSSTMATSVNNHSAARAMIPGSISSMNYQSNFIAPPPPPQQQPQNTSSAQNYSLNQHNAMSLMQKQASTLAPTAPPPAAAPSPTVNQNSLSTNSTTSEPKNLDLTQAEKEHAPKSISFFKSF